MSFIDIVVVDNLLEKGPKEAVRFAFRLFTIFPLLPQRSTILGVDKKA